MDPSRSPARGLVEALLEEFLISLASPLCRYPIQSPRPGCYGDREDLPGVRNYGNRVPDELFDVYCFAKKLQGTVGERIN